MSSEVVTAVRYDTPGLVRTLDVGAKALLVLMLGLALAYPDSSGLEGKGAGARAVGYPLLAFAIPAVWWWHWRERASFPWLADLLVTLTCFSDTLGNRMDLYDTVVWFDDFMHFANLAMLTAAVLLLTMHRSSSLGAALERSLAFGATAAVAWELAEYAAFLSRHSERAHAYADTLGDLTLGILGSLLAAVVVHRAWAAGHLRSTAPQLEREPAAA
ncbi:MULTISPECIES: hypothetical protein [unclassified Nocardioides]|uniref:hypothetical protein n=1 Tax=unclassified Nocardioides TaxID=2615069 RepID=UPI0026658E21|nr:hypothetical protein [Nocardioides sp. Arc9.136]WKN47782.1 hypothetical protein OSR43_17295 [Nocardioides sp. Arc9.136]